MLPVTGMPTRANFLFLNVGHFFAHLMMLIYPTVVLALAEDFGRGYGDLLALSIYGFVAFGAGSLPAGWLGDRVSRTTMMTVFFLGIGAAAVLVGLARSPLHIAVALTLVGLFGSIYHPVGIAMLTAQATRVGRDLGINGVFGNLGVAFAAILAAALTEHISWRAAFIVPGAAALLAGVAYAALARRGGGAGPVAAARAGGGRVRLAARDQIRLFAAIAVAAAAGGVIFNVTTIGLPKVFEERLPTVAPSMTDIGGWVTAVLAVAGFSQIAIGYLIDRYPFKLVFFGVLAVEAPLHYLAATALDWTMLGVALPLMLLVFGSIPIYDAIVARYVADAWRARVYAAKYVLSLGVSALAVPLISWFHASPQGFSGLFETLAVLAVAVGLCALLLPAERRAAAPA